MIKNTGCDFVHNHRTLDIYPLPEASQPKQDSTVTRQKLIDHLLCRGIGVPGVQSPVAPVDSDHHIDNVGAIDPLLFIVASEPSSTGIYQVVPVLHDSSHESGHYVVEHHPPVRQWPLPQSSIFIVHSRSCKMAQPDGGSSRIAVFLETPLL